MHLQDKISDTNCGNFVEGGRLRIFACGKIIKNSMSGQIVNLQSVQILSLKVHKIYYSFCCMWIYHIARNNISNTNYVYTKQLVKLQY